MRWRYEQEKKTKRTALGAGEINIAMERVTTALHPTPDGCERSELAHK